jgi:hypothetical protein
MTKPISMIRDKHSKRPSINYHDQKAYYQNFLYHKDEPEFRDSDLQKQKVNLSYLLIKENRYLLKRKVLKRGKRITSFSALED